MSRVPLNHLFPAMAYHVRDVMLKHARPDCCIATTAVLKRAFRHFRYNSAPVPVLVLVENPNMVALMDSNAEIPEPGAVRDALLDRKKAYSVGIMRNDDDPKKFGGHLVLHVNDGLNGYLVDASIEQVNRPAWNIRMPKFISARMSPAFFEGKPVCCKIRDCRVTYEPIKNQTWRTSPDWMNELRYRGALNEIIALTKQTLLECAETGRYPEQI